MASLSRAFYDRYILHSEGGYKPRHAADDETLFGLRADNFAAMMRQMGPSQRNAMPPDVQRLWSNPRGVMHYIASKLEPNDNYGRTSEVPRTHASGADIRAVNAVKSAVFQFYQHEYCDTPGISLFPQRIANLATDVSVHRGGAVALWTVERAMQEVGLTGGANIKTAQVVDSQLFQKVAPEYFTHKKAEQLADKLHHASPEQLQLMEHYIAKWRRVYYKEQVRIEGEKAQHSGGVEAQQLYAYHKNCLPSWMERVSSMVDEPHLTQLAARYEAKKVTRPGEQGIAMAANPVHGYHVSVPIPHARQGHVLEAAYAQMIAADGGKSMADGGTVPGQVALELNGKVVRYVVDAKNIEAVKFQLPMPAGVTWAHRGEKTAVVDGAQVANPYPNAETLLYRGQSGAVVAVPITATLNKRIGWANLEQSWLWPLASDSIPTQFSLNGRQLNPKESALLLIDTAAAADRPYIWVKDNDSPTLLPAVMRTSTPRQR